MNNLERRYRETQSDAMKREIEECMSQSPCPDCGGKRLRREALAVTVGGISIHEFCEKPITEALAFLDTIAPIDPSLSGKIKSLTVAPMFAEAIERIYQEISVSKLWL